MKSPTVDEVKTWKAMALALCHKIEQLPASAFATELSTDASAIHGKLQDAVVDYKTYQTVKDWEP